MQQRIKYVWHQVPLFRFVWPFILGIIIGVTVPNTLFGIVAMCVAAVGLVLSFITSRNERLASTLKMLGILCLGYAFTVANTERLRPDHITHQAVGFEDQLIIGEVVSDPIPRSKSVKFEFEVDRLGKDSSWVQTSGRTIAYIELDSSAKTVRLGDELILNSRLRTVKPPQNPNAFDYKRYLSFQQIDHQLYARANQWSRINVGSGFFRILSTWQHKTISILSARGIEGEELAIISALLIGYKHHLSGEQKQAFASAGAMHVLAVSGLHVGIIYLLVLTLLKPMNRMRFGNWLNSMVLLAVIWGFAAITGFSPSVSRASTMFSFVIVGKLIDRHTDVFNTITASAIFYC